MEARQQLALLFYGATQRTLAQRKLVAAELSRGQGEHMGVISQPKHLGRCEGLKWDGITVAEWQHACLRGFLWAHQRLKFGVCPDCSSPSKSSRSSVWSLLSSSIYSTLQSIIQKLLTFSRNWSDLLSVLSTRSCLLNCACCFSFKLHWTQTRSLDFRCPLIWLLASVSYTSSLLFHRNRFIDSIKMGRKLKLIFCLDLFFTLLFGLLAFTFCFKGRTKDQSGSNHLLWSGITQNKPEPRGEKCMKRIIR